MQNTTKVKKQTTVVRNSTTVVRIRHHRGKTKHRRRKEKQHCAKRSLWEESTRVPLIIAAPGLGNANCTRPVGLIDLYPTLNELCGLARPPQMLEGHSLLPLLRKPDESWPHPAITTFHQNDHTIRTEHWRYIRYANGDEELYDRAVDPHEWHNLAANPEHKGTIAELREHLPKVNSANAPERSPVR